VNRAKDTEAIKTAREGEKLELEIEDLRRWRLKLVVPALTVLASVLIAVVGWTLQVLASERQQRQAQQQYAQAEQFHDDEVFSADIGRLSNTDPTQRASAALSLVPFARNDVGSASATKYGVLAVTALLERLDVESSDGVVNAVTSSLEAVGAPALPYLRTKNQRVSQSLTQRAGRYIAAVILTTYPGQRAPEAPADPLTGLLSGIEPTVLSPSATLLKAKLMKQLASIIRYEAFPGVPPVGPFGEKLDFSDVWQTTLGSTMSSSISSSIGTFARLSHHDLKNVEDTSIADIERAGRELAALDVTIEDILNKSHGARALDLSQTVLLNMHFDPGLSLEAASFRGSYLMGDATGVSMPCVDLSNSDISNLDLTRADLRGATLTGTVGLRLNNTTVLDGGNWWAMNGDSGPLRLTRDLVADKAKREKLKNNLCVGLAAARAVQ
jgi:hypothetical protein